MKHLIPFVCLALSYQLGCTGPVAQDGTVQTGGKKSAASKANIGETNDDETKKNSDSASSEESDDVHDRSHTDANTELATDTTNISPNALGTPVTASTTLPPSTVQNGNIVEFRIKAGTGNGPWNDEASRINVKVGQELHIVNDDDRTHLMHTNGAPFFHPFVPIAPGGKAIYKIASPLPNGALYDHQTKGKIYINAER